MLSLTLANRTRKPTDERSKKTKSKLLRDKRTWLSANEVLYINSTKEEVNTFHMLQMFVNFQQPGTPVFVMLKSYLNILLVFTQLNTTLLHKQCIFIYIFTFSYKAHFQKFMEVNSLRINWLSLAPFQLYNFEVTKQVLVMQDDNAASVTYQRGRMW